MQLVHADNVKETALVTGLGDYQLAGAEPNSQSFVAGIGNSKYCLYAATDGTNRESGIGMVTDGAPDTLSRWYISSSTNAGAKVNWGAGTTVTVVCSPISVLVDMLTARAGAADPNGIINNRTDWTWSHTPGTRTLQVAPVGASASFWSNGLKFTKTSAQSVVHGDVEGLWYFYFDDTGTLQATQSFASAIIGTYAIVHIIYWDATNKLAIPRVQFEQHPHDVITGAEHIIRHLTDGSKYNKGQPGIEMGVTLGDGSLDAHIQVSSTAGSFYDEDLYHSVPSRNATDTAIKLYRTGANGNWRMEETHSAIIRRGAGRAYYNQYTGGAWQDTEVPEGQFFHVYEYTFNSDPVVYVYVQGQQVFATVEEAQAAAQIRPDLGVLPGYEMLLVGTAIVQTSSAYSNTYKSRIVATHTGAGWYDWRTATPQAGSGASGGGVGDHLDFAASTQGAPAAGNVRIFNKVQAGRQMLAMIDPSGLDTVLQPHLAKNGWASWKPPFTGTTINVIGAAALSGTGTATSAPYASTTLHTRTQRVDYLVTTAAANAVAGVRYGSAVWRGTDGFHHIFRGCPATGNTNANRRGFIGMQASTAAPTDVNPSTLLNIVGVGYDSADTNWQVMTNNGAGAAAKIDTGIAKPSSDRQTIYSVMVFAPPGGAWFGVRLVDEDTGATYESGQLSADIPAATQALTWNCYASVGGISSVVGYTFAGHWFDRDN